MNRYGSLNFLDKKGGIKMLPKYDSNNPSLLESMVCFTDILGFSNLIMQSTNRQRGSILLKELHSILTEQYAQMNLLNPHGHFKAFTDNVILAYPKFEDGEGQSGSVFMSFIDFQLEMTLNGYFLRGGIALGDYYGDDNFAYGPALIDAHNLECGKAINPRIILSEEMVDMVEVHLNYYSSLAFAPQFSHLLIDNRDEICFINYLYGLQEAYASSEEEEDFNLYVRKMLKHKEIVEMNLRQFKGNTAIYAKYEWVAQYHNYYCREYFTNSAVQTFNLKIQGVSNGDFSRIVISKTFTI